MNTHVFQVSERADAPPRFPMEFVDQVAGRAAAADPICTVEADDYLVGMGVEDFLVCPRRLKQVEKDAAALGAQVRVKQEQSKGARKTLVLRFVRMGAAVRDDPRVGRTPARVLRVLDELDAHRLQLATRYELLIARDRQAVQRLHSAKKLLMYVKIMTFETRRSAMEDSKFQFADKFRKWHAQITSDDVGPMATPHKRVVGEKHPAEDMLVDTSPGQPEKDSYNSNPAPKATTSSILRQNRSTGAAPRKRVTFAMDVSPENVRVAGQSATASSAASVPTPSPSQPVPAALSEAAVPPKPRSYGVDEGRAYLLALVGPHVDIVSKLQDLATAVQSVPLATMSKDFIVAAGLKVICIMITRYDHCCPCLTVIL
ncbi:unnamed protein product [Phytophthora fragariaefolia]|uniref:Unnamed protein product n=1 Tax=Phytophthora fragariaefolia TaxID=1490495 RepID=A0A9W6XPU0_9STRA|nr:unnamed protein product [Phytophthora fragariaefolia]